MKSIREIAKLSGVSTATVSRYVNKSGTVSEKSSKKIQLVIDEHGYIPNENAKAIFAGRSMEVGLIVQNVTNPFFSELVDKIIQIANENQLAITINNAMGDADKELECFQNMQKRRVSGMIVVNTTNPNIYIDNKIPTTALERPIYNANYINVENEKGVFELLINIDAKDFENIVYIESVLPNENCSRRKKGLVDYCKKYNKNFKSVKVDDANQEIGQEIINQIYKSDLAVCWNDFVAHKVISTLYRLDAANPISVVGFDNIKLNDFFPYKLTTVDQNITGLAEEALRLLLNTMETQQVHNLNIMPKVIVGNTVVK